MSFELSSLIFQTETSKLKEAKAAIDDLAVSMRGLDKATAEETKGAVETVKISAELARAKRDLVKAEDSLANATANAANNAKKRGQAEQAAAQATEESTSKLSAAEKVHERIATKVELLRSGFINLTNESINLGKGFTTSQAAALANLKVLSASGDLIKEVAQEFKNLNAFSSAKPFDPTVAGLERLRKETQELIMVNEYMAKGFGLTKDQITALARDSEALRQQFNQMGKSESDLSAALNKLEKDTVEAAQAFNKLKNAATEADKIAKEQAKALQTQANSLRESFNQVVQIHTWKQQHEEKLYQQEMQDLREYFTAQNITNEAIERSQKESFDNRVYYHKLKQQQDRQNYEQDMKQLRDYYQQMQEVSMQAERELAKIDQRIAKEKAQTNYLNQGATRSTANVAADMQIRGVPQNVIDSFIKEATAKEKAAKASQDHANAIRNVQAAEERLFGTMQHLNDGVSQNATLNERAALALGSYERNLRLAGIAGEEAATKIKAFKTAQEQVSKMEQQRNVNQLSRSLTPQISDVAVSLYGGMSPMTVLMQQGLQVRDLIAQSRVETDKLAEAFKKAGSDMVGSIVGTAKAMRSLLTGTIVEAGEAVMRGLISPFRLLYEAADSAKDFLLFKYLDKDIQSANASLGNFSTVWNNFLAQGRATLTVLSSIGAIIGGAFLIGAYQVMKATNEMNSQLIQFGAMLGVTSGQAKELASTLSNVTGETFAASLETVGKFAKSGISDFKELSAATASAIELQKYLGIEVSTTAEKYQKVTEDPVKGLIELAKNTGLVTEAEIRHIRELEKKEGKTKAVAEAVKLVTRANEDMATLGKENLSEVEKLWIDIKKAANDAWAAVQKAATDVDMYQGFRDVLAKIKLSIQQALTLGEGFVRLLKEIITFNATGDFTAKLNSYIDSKLSANLGEYEQTMKDIYDTSVKSTAQQEREAKARQANANAANRLKDEFKDEDKAKKKSLKDVDDLEKAYQRVIEKFSDLKIQAQAAGTDMNLPIEATTKAYVALQDVIKSPEWDKWTTKEKEKILLHWEEANALEVKNILLKKQEDALKKLQTVWDNFAKLNLKYDEEIKAANEELNFQTSILFKSETQIKKMTREYEEQKNIAKINAEYEKERLNLLLEYNQAIKDVDPLTANILQTDYLNRQSEIEKKSQEKVLIERQKTNLKVVQDFEKKWRDIQDGISDALYTSLTKGGKEGAKQFRKFMEEQLKKEFVLPAIKAVVNLVTESGLSLVGAGISALMGSSASSGSSGSASNYLGMANNASSMYNMASGMYGIYTNGLNYTLGSSVSSAGAYIGSAGTQAFGAGLAGGSNVGTAISLYNSAAYTAAMEGVAAQAAADAAIAAGNSAAASEAATLAAQKAAEAAAYQTTAEGLAAGAGANSTLSTIASYIGELASGPVGWVVAILTSMYEANKLFKQGITWGNFTEKNKDTPQFWLNEPGLVRTIMDRDLANILGEDFVNSELHQTLSLGPLAAALTTWVNGGLFGNTGQRGSVLEGNFSESSGGFTGRSGALMKKTGGLFSSSREWTEWSDLPATTDLFFDVLYASVRGGFVTLGQSLGDNSIEDLLKGFEYSYSEGGTNIEKHIATMTERLTEAMGKHLLPSIEKLAVTVETDGKKVTETWNQTFQRVVLEASAVSNVFDLLGNSLAGIYKNDTNKILVASDAFVKIFGSIDAMNTSINAYYENFYSAEEKRERQLKLIQQRLLQAGLEVTTAQIENATRDDFRKLADSYLKQGESGTVAFKALMDVQAAFAALTPVTEEVVGVITKLNHLSADYDEYFSKYYSAEDNRVRNIQKITQTLNNAGFSLTTDQVAKATTQQFKDLVAYFYSMGEAGITAVNALMEVQGAFYALNEAVDTVTKRVNSEIGNQAQEKALDDYNNALQGYTTETTNALQTQLNSQKQLADDYKKIAEDMRKYRSTLQVSDTNPQGILDRYSIAKAKFSSTSALAATGDITAMSGLTSVTQDFLGLSKATAGSKGQYAVDYAKVLAALDVTEIKAQSEADRLQASVDSINAQMNNISSNATSATKSLLSIDAAMKALLDAVKASASIGAGASSGAVDAINKAGLGSTWVDTSTGKPATSTTTTANKMYVSSRGAVYTYTPEGEGKVTTSSGAYAHKDLITSAKEALAAGNPRAIYNWAWDNGITLSEVDALLGWSSGTSSGWAVANGLPTFASGGSYSGGVALVGEEGPELINFRNPGQVYNASQTRGILNADNSELLNALINEVSLLRAETRATAIHSAKTSKILDRAIGKDDSLNVSVVA